MIGWREVLDGAARCALVEGDCVEVMRGMPDNSISAVCTDPPYGLGTRDPTVDEIIAYLRGDALDTGGDFMGREWQVPSVAIWREVWRVCKPGAHVLCFAGTRTLDLIALGLRAAGFEFRDTISYEGVLRWVHGQGFPKGIAVGKAIDRAAGVEREPLGMGAASCRFLARGQPCRCAGDGNRAAQSGPTVHTPATAPATDAARQWEGWNVALKPAWEPILCFRKPLSERNVAANVLKHGTGALNIDGCRVVPATKDETLGGIAERVAAVAASVLRERDGEPSADRRYTGAGGADFAATPGPRGGDVRGRWPANLVLSHADGCVRVGTRKVRGNGDGGGLATSGYEGGPRQPGKGTADADGMEEVEAFACVEGCPVAALDAQAGDRPSTLTGQADPSRSHPHPSSVEHCDSMFGVGAAQANVYADGPNVSRFFPCFGGSTTCRVCALPLTPARGSQELCPGNGDSQEPANGVESGTSVRAPTESSAPADVEPTQRKLTSSPIPESQLVANDAAASSIHGFPHSGDSVPPCARDSRSTPLAQVVRDAASLCDSCVTAIARIVAQASQDLDVVWHRGLASISAHGRLTLLRCLARAAEQQESIGITLTTAQWARLCGSVTSATAASTAANRAGSDGGLAGFRYQSKASGDAERWFYCRVCALAGPKSLAGRHKHGGVSKGPLFADGTIRRCPEHDAAIPSGATAYSCGCPIQYATPDKEAGTGDRRPRAVVWHPT